MGDAHRLDPELFADFIHESEELIEGLIEDVLTLEDEPSNLELIQKVFRHLHTLKGNAGFLNYGPMVELSHRAEDLMDMVRTGQLGVTTTLTDTLLLVADALRTLLERIKDPNVPPPEVESLHQRLALLGVQGEHDDGTVEAGVDSEGPAVKHGNDAAAGGRDAHTLRVDVVRIDQIMNQVGELVLERNRMQQLVAEARGGATLDRLIEPLSETAGRIHSITTELQMAILKVRMIPVERVFRKFPRVVRDLAAKLGKEVRFSFTGGDTELDKTVAEAIVDPLTHLVRNSMDHGLETPEVRLRSGKPSTGELSLGAVHEGNHILVQVRDDGQGIDPARILRKARSNGLISEEQAVLMGPTDILSLLFHPGFSTNDSVNDVSGRGVGLDVVKTRLAEYHGIIEMKSEPGVGTEITLKLPLTLAIVPSLLVEVAGNDFAVPLGSVIEVVNEEPQNFHLFHGRPVLRWRDRVLPVVDLADEFRLVRRAGPPAARKAVIVGLAEKQVCFLVDSMLGQEEVVIKTLGDYLGKVPGIAGGTIMGDGRVALIVDIPALVGSAHQNGAPRLAVA